MDPFGQSSFFSSFHPLVEPVATLSIPFRDISSPISPPKLSQSDSHNHSYRNAVSPSFESGAVHSLCNAPPLPFAPPCENTDLNVTLLVPPLTPNSTFSQVPPEVQVPGNRPLHAIANHEPVGYVGHPGTLSLFEHGALFDGASMSPQSLVRVDSPGPDSIESSKLPSPHPSSVMCRCGRFVGRLRL